MRDIVRSSCVTQRLCRINYEPTRERERALWRRTAWDARRRRKGLKKNLESRRYYMCGFSRVYQLHRSPRGSCTPPRVKRRTEKETRCSAGRCAPGDSRSSPSLARRAHIIQLYVIHVEDSKIRDARVASIYIQRSR